MFVLQKRQKVYSEQKILKIIKLILTSGTTRQKNILFLSKIYYYTNTWYTYLLSYISSLWTFGIADISQAYADLSSNCSHLSGRIPSYSPLGKWQRAVYFIAPALEEEQYPESSLFTTIGKPRSEDWRPAVRWCGPTDSWIYSEK